jgi:hypothetical protein
MHGEDMGVKRANEKVFEAHRATVSMERSREGEERESVQMKPNSSSNVLPDSPNVN